MNAATGRPGQSPKVPGLNVSVLGTSPVQSAEPGTPLAPDVLGDVIRAEVTQVSTGLAQYSITFNNWFLSLPTDRAAMSAAAVIAANGPTELLSGPNNSPAWPRFKYDSFGILTFGQRLRIDMRYWPGEQSPALGAPSAQDWFAMVSGPITDMRFSFATGQGAQVTVAGEDDLSTLKDKQKDRINLDRTAEVSIVRQILRRANLPLTFADPKMAYPAFVTHDANGIQEGLQSGQCWHDLINKLADRLDFEAFAEFRDPPPAQLPPPAQWSPPPLDFHFEPYRGRVAFDPQQRDIYRIDRERNMLDFVPSIKVDDQALSAEVRGRHRDPQQGHEVLGSAQADVVADELQLDPALDGALTTAANVRSAFFPNRVSWLVVPNQTNMDKDRADANAEAAMRKKARELFSIDVTAVGDPRIRPGRMIEIRGMRPPFDGFYYIKKTVHTYGVDGLRTKISACRPGMPLPTNGGYSTLLGSSL